MLDKYFLSCIVITFVENAAFGDISLDYYFGFEDSLRTSKYMANCNSHGVRDACQSRCGADHACLLGKCFCVEVKPQFKDGVIDELLSRTKAVEQKDSSEENSSSGSESEETERKPVDLRRGFLGHGCHSLEKADECLRQCSVSGQQGFCDENQECNCGVYRNNFVGRSIKMSNMYKTSRGLYNYLVTMETADSAGHPALRHHIAHFCPNLDVARECIYKCMQRGKPAFCGKDHVCYCGHKYHTHKTGEESAEAAGNGYGEFRDLYIKFFGPNAAK